MLNSSKEILVLGIESAIGGGSIALCKGNEVLRSISGTESVSRAEELLPNIKTLLAETGLDRSEIGFIAVSRGPGSFTGIRIGISTALGLARGLNIPCVGISLIDCIFEHCGSNAPTIIAVPVGRTDIAWRAFVDDHSDTRVEDISVFLDKIDDYGDTIVLIHPEIFKMVSDEDSRIRRCRAIDTDLAGVIGVEAAKWTDRSDLAPIYIYNQARAGNLF